MIRAAYFDCFSGASGDMLLGALVDCGASLDEIASALAGLPVDGYVLRQGRVMRGAIAATKVDVMLDRREQPHRGLETIRHIIAGSGLPPVDQARGVAVFTALAEAEAKVHGVDLDAVAFHEVGAVDAIVDVLGTIVGLRLLGVQQVYVSELPAGGGTTQTAHGTIPIPGPATLELLARARAPMRPPRAGESFELVTPTGAALLTALGTFGRPAMRLERVGYGAGGRDTPGRPNILRCWLGEVESAAGSHETRTLLVVETNIDDMNPEVYSWATERLFAAGALDVWYTPIQMKKGRPGVMLQALCPVEAEQTVVATFLSETSTLGVRVREVRRHAANRRTLTFTSSLGEVRVKLKLLEGEAPRLSPEFEDCRALAARNGLSLLEVYQTVAEEARRHLNSA